MAAIASSFSISPAVSARQSDIFETDDELLLLEVFLDRRRLTEALPVVQRGQEVRVPLGELARLLDIDLRIDAHTGKVSGKIEDTQRTVALDLKSGEAFAGGARFRISTEDAQAMETDIFVTLALLEKLLPLATKLDSAALSLELLALEKLPLQKRLDRMSLLQGLNSEQNATEPVLSLSSDNKTSLVPSFDVTLEVGGDSQSKSPYGRYDVRLGNALFGAGLQAFIASDNNAKPSVARLLFAQSDRDGSLLGPLGATRFAVGDTFVPALPIGPRSEAASGFMISTRPLEQASVFEKIDLRGELATGHDVQLFVNDILRASQATPQQGRYEFLDVPLVRGINVIRIVDYGPQGQRTEATEVITVGGGQLAAGQSIVEFGAGWQHRTIFNFGSQEPSPPGDGSIRAAVNFMHGISERWTVAAGAGIYTGADERRRQMFTVGLRGAVGGVALEVDAGASPSNGRALAMGFAGRPFGLALTARRRQYWGHLIDEAATRGGEARPALNSTEASLDMTLKPTRSFTIPLSLRVARDAYVDGGVSEIVSLNSSTLNSGIVTSVAADYARQSVRAGPTQKQASASVAMAGDLGTSWQMRGVADLSILPSAALRSVSLSADRRLGSNFAADLGIGRSFRDADRTTAQAGLSIQSRMGALSINGSYAWPNGDWRIGLQWNFSIVRNPLSRRFAIDRPGAAAGGNFAIESFLDRDGNGLRDPGDDPIAGLRIVNGRTEAVTDLNGQAMLTGLGSAPTVRVAVNTDNLDMPYVDTPPRNIEFEPIGGAFATTAYPFKPTGELMLHLRLQRPDGSLIGVSALRLILSRDGKQQREARTEFDGSVFFDKLQPGVYSLTLDPSQAARGGLALLKPVIFSIPPAGGSLPDINASIIFQETGS